jgi:hypothetical protein
VLSYFDELLRAEMNQKVPTGVPTTGSGIGAGSLAARGICIVITAKGICIVMTGPNRKSNFGIVSFHWC